MLEGLAGGTHPDLLVGYQTSDDAAVYRLDDDTALVLTTDIITPPVDDPYVFGQIAAANALSDVYAMGGRPIVCLNLVGFPSNRLDAEVLQQMVAGAASKVAEAGAVLAGGHTMEDEEPKLGLSVTGLVHPQRYWANRGARPGDLLILTKPIGSGVLFNAHRKGRISPGAMEVCIEVLTTLNRAAAEVLSGFEVHAATDVTGFGLAGHGLEMARASDVALRIDADDVPILPEALDAYERGTSTGVNAANLENVRPSMRFDRPLPGPVQELLVDPQTSGGLLAAVPADRGEELLAALREAGVDGARAIGRVEAFGGEHRLIFG